MPYPYDTTFAWSFPSLPVVIHQIEGGAGTLPLPALIDTGADATLIPTVHLNMRMTRQQPYASFNAIANLADKAGIIEVTVEAVNAEGFDPVWLRNAVEPLDEADVVRDM